MSTTDKCPHCGAGVSELCPAGFYLCGSSVGIKFHQSDLCRERAAHAETRKELEAWKSEAEDLTWNLAGCSTFSGGFDPDVDFDESKARAGLRDVVRMAKELKETKAALTREREKWEKLRVWVGERTEYTFGKRCLDEMNRLDAEAKEGQQ